MLSGIDHLGWFITAGILLNLTPGPDVLYIVTHSLKSGWRAGATAALGITAGCFVHVALATLGVSALLVASGVAFTAVKWLGAGYLLVIGWSMLGLRQKTPLKATDLATKPIAASPLDICAVAQKDLLKVFLNGFLTNVLNPKVALFFLAFLPQFIVVGAPNTALSFGVLGLIFIANGLWVCLAYAALAAAVSRQFSVLQHGMRWLERVAGCLFMGFGCKLALSDNPTL
jgi:threonine/homoserine/homoserine lactone efflux protein